MLEGANDVEGLKVLEIAFPAMPDTIELARRTEYDVQNNMAIPDGIHRYNYTSVQEIPFSFKLHYRDELYCTQGSLTLLQIAARLHALVTPFGDSLQSSVTVGNDAPIVGTAPDTGAKPSGSEKPIQARAQSSGSPTFTVSENAKFDPPVTCSLELIYTGEGSPGVMCRGYVKDIKVILAGPWLKGPKGAYNLPTSGEYSFTFVHRPSHLNAFSNADAFAPNGQRNAFTEYIRDNLYNTRGIPGSINYRGLSN